MTKQIVQRTIDQLPPSEVRPLIVFEFWAPAGSEGAGSEFERSLSLARFLTSPALKRVRTVAYIPRAVTGHAVLPVLACEQIIMGPDAILGDAGAGETSIGPTMRGGYTEISRSRLTIPEAIALGMLDPQLEIYRVTTGSGVLYTWAEELQRLKEERNDVRAIDTVIPAGRTRSLSWRRAASDGLCQLSGQQRAGRGVGTERAGRSSWSSIRRWADNGGPFASS